MFEKHGYATVDFDDQASVYVINTCSVTEFADKKCRYAVRKAQKLNPEAKIVVIGCYAQLKPQEISEIPGVDLVLGAAEKFNVLQYIDQIGQVDKGMVIAGEVKEANNFIESFSFGDRTRSFLKVQDGCNYNCSFCTIPQARGESRSDTIENVKKNVQIIASQGIKEIVLTGVNLGDFGNGTEVIEGKKPKKEALFIDLIKELDQEEGIQRFRISSIEPNLLTQEIIEFVANSKRFVPHFHIPLQSGSNRILNKMRRRYLKELYTERVGWIRKEMPQCCIGVDVIVGFPGETEEDFQETLQFLSDLEINYLHVFSYSERANTLAKELDNPVPMHIRKERNEILRQLSLRKKRQFYLQNEGLVDTVLLENSKQEHILTGFTRNYIKVQLRADASDVNQLRQVKLDRLNSEGIFDASFV